MRISLVSLSKMASVGSKIPKISLFEGTPRGKVDAAELCANKTTIWFAVPGAFTPGCSKTHLPGFISAAPSLKARGVDEIFCVSVNDPFVQAAWGEAQGADGKVRMLADTNAEFSMALGVAMPNPALGGTRSKRWAALVVNGEIKVWEVEPESAPTGLTCSTEPAFTAKAAAYLK